MRILVVEDSVRLQRVISGALRKSGFAADVAGDGEEGLWLAQSNDYDAIVLDIMLPKLDGISLLRQLRQEDRKTHVLLLTAKDTIDDRVNGLEVGADDYLVKPFALQELLARVRALCRRAYGQKQNRIKVADLEIDTGSRSVWRGGIALELTARDYQLLEYLARRVGQVVSRAEIEAHIYDGAADPMSNVVDSAVCALRRKLGAPNSPPLIHTRRGQGYLLMDAADSGALA